MIASLHRFILRHDDSKVFVVLYIGLAVLLAIFLGLFWLAVVVGLHLLMEMVKQYDHDRRLLPVLTRSLWELKLDIGLVLFGLVIGLYIDVVFGLVGLSHLGRAGAQAAARAGMWPRILRGTLLTLDDVALVAKGAALRTRKPKALQQVEEPKVLAGGGTEAALAVCGAADAGPIFEPGSSGTEGEPVDTPSNIPRGAQLWGGWIAAKWGLGDKVALGFTLLSFLLLLAAPLLTHHTVAGAWAEVLSEMHPFPH